MTPRSAMLASLVASLGFTPSAQAQAMDPLERRVEECRQAHDGECLLTLAEFESAAEAFERFSHKQPGHPRAPASLTQAVRLRRELGQAQRALGDGDDFRRLFPEHPRLSDVAHEVFRLGERYAEDGQIDQAIAHYQQYLRKWGEIGGDDLSIMAHVRLAA